MSQLIAIKTIQLFLGKYTVIQIIFVSLHAKCIVVWIGKNGQ